MPQNSYGKMRRTRKQLTARGKTGITPYMKVFKEGDHVHIDFVPSSPIQHPRFEGKTGTVTGKRGRNYIVSVTDGNKNKQVFARPEHLRLQK